VFAALKMFCVVRWQDLRALQLIFAVQPPKQLPPLLLDCLRYFLHIGQTLQESRRQQQRQAAVILEQQQQAAAAASVSSSSASSADQHTQEEKSAKSDVLSASELESAATPERSPVKDSSKTGDEDAEANTASHVTAGDADGDAQSQPAADESTSASEPQITDNTSECASSTTEDQGAKTRREEGKGSGKLCLVGC